VAVLREHLFRVELANGHQLVGFVKGRNRVILAGLTTGGRVTLIVSPADLSKGMIVEAVH
jgi:translation initiation factor IF-1